MEEMLEMCCDFKIFEENKNNFQYFRDINIRKLTMLWYVIKYFQESIFLLMSLYQIVFSYLDGIVLSFQSFMS